MVFVFFLFCESWILNFESCVLDLGLGDLVTVVTVVRVSALPKGGVV